MLQMIDCLRRGPRQAAKRGAPESSPAEEDGGGGRHYLCRACGSRITPVAARTEAGGGFEHAFFNPSGEVFRIGCFSRAPGCAVHGVPTQEHTWFAGFAWSFAFCAACAAQLGWRFEGPGRSFFGLILDALEEEREEG